MKKILDKTNFKTVLVTGGAGYVGSVLVPKLLREGFEVKVLDLFIYGEHVLDAHKQNPRLKLIKGDIRDRALLERELDGMDVVIHLACISNDPSFELDPNLSKSINYDAFLTLVDVSKSKRVKRFIYASSSSVYGVKQEPLVTEDIALNPLTDYSKYKAMCEKYLLKHITTDFVGLVIRPATVCGYAPRLRLDLVVNILATSAIRKSKIRVFGGDQMRPNIHIEDITDLYVLSLKYPDIKIQGKIYNAGYQNYRVMDLAEIVKSQIGKQVEIECVPSDDVRSYHISSQKIEAELNFKPKHNIEGAVRDLKRAFKTGLIKDPDDIHYYNIKTMNAVHLK